MKQKNTTDSKSANRRRLVKSVTEAFINEAILNLQIDPRGKNEQEINKEIMTYLKYILNNDIKLEYYTDHRKSILEESRRFQSLEKYEFSCVFYAIWFEHWINNIVAIFGVKKGLSSNEIIQIIRESSVRSKYSWVPKLLGVPNISTKHITLVLHLFDLRNAFIHFKWKGYLTNEDKRQKEELKNVLQQIGKTVEYFKRFENKWVYHSSRKKVKKIIRAKPNPRLSPTASSNRS